MDDTTLLHGALDTIQFLINDAMTVPARWCNGESVRIVVGRPGVHFLRRVIPKDFTTWYSRLPCLALSIKNG